ncbi:MAG: Mur ligase family protein, partial [Anaerolineales bacterium]
NFDIGVVTNITHEHLDFHGSYEAYRSAKARLFDIMAGESAKAREDVRWAILNRDDDAFDYLDDYIRQLNQRMQPGINLLRYGTQGPVDVFAENILETPQGVTFVTVGADFRLPVICQLPGVYNVSNCLAAIASTVVGLGIDPIYAAQGIHNLKAIPGRMERITNELGFIAIVDFAHTPNALKRSLAATRKLTDHPGNPGRLIAVFGSAGLRDRAKRRMMAEISADQADITILTAEDPRSESLDDILAEMGAGCLSRGGIEGETFWRVRDRGSAIRFAVSLARPGDVVIVLGKGHEQSMCFGETEYAWDDRVAMRAAIAGLAGVEGPPMPYLPTQDEL